MPTAYALVRHALRLCGVIDAHEAVPPGEGQDGLEALNAMLDTWRLERLLIYVVDRQVFTLTANQQTYTLGPSGTFNTTPLYGATTPRPLKLEGAGLLDQTQAPALEVPLYLLSDQEYREIRLKGLTSSWPQWVSYDPTQPLGTVYFWPGPTVTRQVALYLWRPLARWATIHTDLTLPEGYEEAISYNLARRIAPEYGVQLLPDVVGTAIDTKAVIQRFNTVATELVLDDRCPGLTGVRSHFHELTGEVT